jgi:hypothetical protein
LIEQPTGGVCGRSAIKMNKRPKWTKAPHLARSMVSLSNWIVP